MYKSSFLEQLFNILFPDSGKHRTAIRRIAGHGTGKKAIYQIGHLIIAQHLSVNDSCCTRQCQRKDCPDFFLDVTAFLLAVCTILRTSSTGFNPSMPEGIPLIA